MRHNLLRGVAAAAVLVGTSAYAADLPVYVEPVEPAPVMDVVTYSFTGAWVGVQAGAVFGGELDDLFDDDFDFDDFDDDGEFGDDTTWEAGVAAGFDWQMGSFVFGVLGDVNWVHELGRGTGFSSTYDVEVDPIAAGLLADDFEDVLDVANPTDDPTLTDEAALAGEAFFNGGTFEVPLAVVPEGDGDTFTGTDLGPIDLSALGVGDQVLVFDAEAGTIDDTFAMSEELNWYATARARAGMAFGRFMLYGTGGLSYGNVETSWSGTRTYDEAAADLAFGAGGQTIDIGPDAGDLTEIGTLAEFDDGEEGALPDGCVGDDTGPVVCSTSGSEDDDRWGYALGAGTEFLVTQNFSIGAEYLYVNLGSGDDLEIDSDLPGAEYDDAESEDFDFHTVKVRGAFRF